MKKIIVAVILFISITTFGQVQRDTIPYNYAEFIALLTDIGLNSQQISMLSSILQGQNYVDINQYQLLLDRVSALEDSITALRNSIGYITPTFPTTPTNLVASSDGTNINLIWNKFHISPTADSFAVFYTTINPNQFEGNWTTLDYVTDSVFQHTGVSPNIVYWYHVKAIIGTTFSNASNTDSAYVYEAPVVENVKYVYTTALGSGSGVDSANAMAYTNLTGLTAGDVVLFLGGNYTSTIYPSFSGNQNGLITLKSSYYKGAKFVNVNNGFYLQNDSYLKIQGFNFQRCGQGVTVRTGCNVIYIDSNYVEKGRGQGTLAHISGPSSGSIDLTMDSIFIRYNYVVNDSQTTNETDIIYMQWTNNVWVQNNTLLQNNITGTGHNDCVQTAAPIGNVIIANNKITQTKAASSHGMMINTSNLNYRHVIYNNVVFLNGALAFGIEDYQGSSGGQGKTYFINNTLANITVSATWVAPTLASDAIDTYVYNNIAYSADAEGYAHLWYNVPRTGTNFTHWDYNMWVSDIDWGISYNQNTYTMAQWQALGADTHSFYSATTNYPLFTDLANGDLTLQALSPAKNTGGNYQTLIESFGLEWKTIEGTNRDSTPDLGAY